jgi:hypothetical protein
MMQPCTQQFVGRQHPPPHARQRCGYSTCHSNLDPRRPVFGHWTAAATCPMYMEPCGREFDGPVCTAARFVHALQASQQGLTSAAARYGAARGMLSVLGPAMWALFAGELAVKSIGTDYGRVVRAMYTLAQVRCQLVLCAILVFPAAQQGCQDAYAACCRTHEVSSLSLLVCRCEW